MNNTLGSMRIAVFGISRSGKDFSISSAIKTLEKKDINFAHYPGIPTIKKLSLEVFNKELYEVQVEERGILMDQFRESISNRNEIPRLIQDEHYCFPTLYNGEVLRNKYTDAKFPYSIIPNKNNDRTYEVIFREQWILEYDLVIYLNPESKVVLDRIKSSNDEKSNPYITVEDIESWKNFERYSLECLCSPTKILFKIINKNYGMDKDLVDIIEEFYNQ